MDVNQTAQTDLALPIVFLAKKDCTLPFYVDYRDLNKVIFWDSNSKPDMNECIELLSDTSIFSILHGDRGYCKVEVGEQDRDKMTFTYNHRLFCFTQMQFWAGKRRGKGKQAMDVLGIQVKWQFALDFLDDIVISSGTPDESL